MDLYFLTARGNKMADDKQKHFGTGEEMMTEQRASRVMLPVAPTSGGTELTGSGEVLTQEAQTVEGVKTRPRLSGAQWRKLQKQRAIEKGEQPPVFSRGKKKKGAVTPSPAEPAIPGTSTGKRVISLGSREEEGSNKKPRGGETPPGIKKTYAATAANLPRVALTCADYLGRELPEDMCKEIRERIVERVLDIEEGAFAPRFCDSFPRKGAMYFVCADEQTKTWLESIAGGVEVQPGVNLRVVQPEDIPKVHKVGVFLPSGVKNADSLLRAIRVQNSGVDTSGWIVLNRGEVAQGGRTQQHLVLGVDGPSLEVIKRRGFRLFAGVGEVTLKLLDRRQPEATPGGGAT